MNVNAAYSESPLVSPAELEIRKLCVHCSNEIPVRRRSTAFCCAGCEAVHALLQERGLGRYYEIRGKDRPVRKPVPVELAEESYSYLDDPDFMDVYATQSGGKRMMRFFLEGVHCAACVWLTERIGEFVAHVDYARLNLGDSVVQVRLGEQGSFAAVARELARLGYRPHPVHTDEIDALVRRSDRMLLARTGVAAACAGNIMLLTASLYAGAGGGLMTVFRWGSFALALPVLIFCAQPFYANAWAAAKARQVSIDVPITLGIALGAVSSVFNLLTGSEYLYFDSLSMLVFLMLASRYLLRRAQQAATQSSRLIRFLTPACARRRDPATGALRDVPVDRIQPDDEIEIFTGERVPVDGVIVSGASELDNSLLTGESALVPVHAGDPVFAGTSNQAAPLRVRATASGSATRLGRTLRSVQEDLSRKASIVTYADRIARWFVAAVAIAVVVIFLAGLRLGLHEAVNLALALAIVTCPCAFALATPLALSLSIGRCAREGVLVKGADVLERLSQVKEAIFDKTGTLTHGKHSVEGWSESLPLETDATLLAALVALESRSAHPIARAITEHFSGRVAGPLPEVESFREVLGSGVSGIVGGARYEISSWKGELLADSGGNGVTSAVAIWRDGAMLGVIRLGDRLREESAGTLRRLKAMGLRVGLLSGDSTQAVARVAGQLGLARWTWLGGITPEGKRDAISRLHPRALMVGDGANDANALAAAYVGVAVHGGMEVSLQSADVYCRIPGVRAIPPLIVVARETMRVIHRNFAFSLVYNAIGIAGVICGVVTPLFAAVLMPISAMTVFASSLAGTAKLRGAIREMAG